MSKWFKVEIAIWKSVLVEVDDHEGEDDASQAAFETFLSGKDGEVSGVEEATPEKLESFRRHCDEILSF
jgi:hypothetical protein